jgi:hypothetical protein
MAEQLDEPIDARIPETFIVAEPVVGALERSRVDAHVMDASTHRPFHETRPLERLDVLGCRGERHSVWRGELADGLLALGEPLEHRSPSVVGECAENKVKPVRTFNHIVEYRRA